MTLLIHLYRIDAAIFPLVLELVNRRLKRVVALSKTVFEDIGEADQNGKGYSTRLKLVYQFLQIDGVIGSLVGMNGDVTPLVDREIVFTPVLDVVAVNRVLNCPVFHSLLVAVSGFLSNEFSYPDQRLMATCYRAHRNTFEFPHL